MITHKPPVHCKACGTLVRGRTDKKFCNDYCRNDFNNSLRAGKNNIVRNINNALAKNRRILESFLVNGEGTAKAHRDKMEEAGFIFKYSTHTYSNKKGNRYFFCYDIGYLTLENNRFLIVKRIF